MVSRTEKPQNNKPPKNNKPKVSKSTAYKLGGNNVETNTEDPREAARRAAEERARKNSSTQGALGRKLEQERAQGIKKTRIAESEEKYNEKKNGDELLYD